DRIDQIEAEEEQRRQQEQPWPDAAAQRIPPHQTLLAIRRPRGEQPVEQPVGAPEIGDAGSERDADSNECANDLLNHDIPLPALTALWQLILGVILAFAGMTEWRGHWRGPPALTRLLPLLPFAAQPGYPLPCGRAYSASQADWIWFATSSADLPLTKSTMPVQKAPAPIGPGIRSEPSKRNVVALSRISP